VGPGAGALTQVRRSYVRMVRTSSGNASFRRDQVGQCPGNAGSTAAAMSENHMRPLVYTSLSETMPEPRYSVLGGFVVKETPKATLNQKLSASRVAMMTTPMAMTRSTETREATLTRLLDKARAEDINLYRDARDARDARYYATSASDAGTLHYVTGYSCDCAGFINHGACKHYAALMAALGWIDREPDGPAPACPDCAGKGTVIGTVATGRRTYRYDWQTCPTCHGHKTAA